MVNEWIIKADGKVDDLEANTISAEGLAVELEDLELSSPN